MNTLDIPAQPIPATRRPALRCAIANGIFMLAGAAVTGVQAQEQPQTPTPPSTQMHASAAPAHIRAAAVGTAERTRAEVIAELRCARESGELEAQVLSQYGLTLPARNGTRTSCAPANPGHQMAQGQ